MRRRYIYDPGSGKCVEVFDAPRERRAPMVISDYHEPFRSQADGRIYDSKSSYRRELRARGYEEVGNEFDARHWGERPASTNVADDLRRAAGERGVSVD